MARARIPVGGHGEIGVSLKPVRSSNEYRARVTVRESIAQTRTLEAFTPTKGKAKSRLRTRIAEWQRTGAGLARGASVEAVVIAWLAYRTISTDNTEGENRAQTLAAYDYYARTYIIPGIGSAPIAEVRASELQKSRLVSSQTVKGIPMPGCARRF
ncbi:hypothetical protein [Arthrobacter sp.]|uniref:hypothetical protein n=1 Tax=Arthrobacter sp. TaxID=1667 RepID=UPI003398711B